jgi:antitoxin (DNA-binding transcriptional repressor) of toxin-antitoxin stability system
LRGDVNVDSQGSESGFTDQGGRVEAGEEIVIRRGSTPVARLVAEPATRIRPPGALRGRIEIDDDFDSGLAEFDHLRPSAERAVKPK